MNISPIVYFDNLAVLESLRDRPAKNRRKIEKFESWAKYQYKKLSAMVKTMREDETKKEITLIMDRILDVL